LLAENARVAYIDLDAHQGNGVCHAFLDDDRVFIFDIYNPMLYPSQDAVAAGRIDCAIWMTFVNEEREYLGELEARLPPFLDSITRSKPVGLAIYNAGTDIVAGDPLGQLNVSAEGVLRRDLFVVGELRRLGIPTLMLLSGGYTRTSYQLVADSVIRLLERESNAFGG
jgi:histone deacetylase 11